MSNTNRLTQPRIDASDSTHPVFRLAPLLVSLTCLLLLIFTEQQYGFAIDEASYLWVAEQERLWFAEFPDRGFVESFSAEGLKNRWHFLEPPAARRAESHANFNLPLSQHLLNISWFATHYFVNELLAYRLANMVLFAGTVGCFFHWLAKRYDHGTALVGSGFLVFLPRVFGHTHLAATETTLCCFWFLTLLSSDRLESENTNSKPHRFRIKLIIPGLLLGLTMAVKLTGWFLAPAIAMWLILFRPPGWKSVLAWAIFLPLPMIVLLTPPLWHDPVRGLISYLRNAGDNPWKIPVYFLGTGYRDGLPWWSVFLLTAVTVPITTLIFALLALLTRLWARRTLLFVMPAAVLLGVWLLGLMPVHDGERQYLPVYYCLAGLAAIGFQATTTWLAKSPGRWFARFAVTLLTVAGMTEPVWETLRFAGHGLTYYNRLVGGLDGAAEQGMEISYWWEGLSLSQWRQMLDDVPTNSRIFVHPDHPGLEFLKRWGGWREDLKSVGPDEADFFLLYAKRAAYVVAVSPESNRLVATDLLWMMEHAPAVREVRFQGVRLAVLINRR